MSFRYNISLTLLQTVCRTITFQQGDLKVKRSKKIQKDQLSTGEFLGHGPPPKVGTISSTPQYLIPREYDEYTRIPGLYLLLPSNAINVFILFYSAPCFRGKKGGATGPVPFIRWLRHRFPGSAVRVRGRCHGSTTASFTEGSREPRAADHSAVFNLKLGCKSWWFGDWKSWQLSDVSDWNSRKRNLEVNLLLNRKVCWE